MIDLYYWTTPNGHKITIFLEETGLPYTIKPINISQGRAVRAGIPRDSPNNRIPAIVDHAPADGGGPLAMFESGAILLYLAGKTGQLLSARPARPLRLLRSGSSGRWGTSGRWPGRTITSRTTRRRSCRTRSSATCKETGRLYAVLNRRLADREFVAGDYSIADMACYPWVLPERQGQDIDDFPNLKRWKAAIRDRPAVVRAYELPKGVNPKPTVNDDASRKILFGQDQSVVK